jgi:pimeloyl-ACP methyl ester carboxylesterase
MQEPKVKRAVVQVNGVDLFYRDSGSDRPPILCLHGKWGRGETWVDFMSRYRDRYRIIAPDQRGHGLSGRPVARYAMQDLAADADGILRQLACGPAIVVGHSMGGRVGAYLAALYPREVQALAILDSPFEGPDNLSSLPPDQVKPFDELTAEWPTPFTTHPEAVQHLAKLMGQAASLQYFSDSLVETVEGYDFMFSRYAMAALAEYRQSCFNLLPQIQCPVLLVRAANSWALPREEADQARALIKDCTYFEVANSDHMVYADNPDEFYPQFEQFLGRVQ